METLVVGQAISTVREVWWDIRPHPDFGTVELRMCDGIPTLSEVAAVAALAQCLVDPARRTSIDRGLHAAPPPGAGSLRENKWRAARYGLDAEVIVDEQGNLEPARTPIAELVDELRPARPRARAARPSWTTCGDILDAARATSASARVAPEVIGKPADLVGRSSTCWSSELAATDGVPVDDRGATVDRRRHRPSASPTLARRAGGVPAPPARPPRAVVGGAPDHAPR